MKKDKYGFLYPVIAEEKCIDCNLCKRVCLANEALEGNKPQKCYAVWTRDESDKKCSSSGGVAAGLSRKMIQDGGIVFGAKYVDGFKLHITGASSMEEIKDFRGSKYVQCETADSYISVKKYLISGDKVIYFGTPCQIMGLRKFLQKDYDNLVLVDIICHGVPSFEHLKEYVNNILPEKEITKVTFRGENDFKFTAYEGDNIVFSQGAYDNLYYTAFLAGLNYRESCYACQFAKEERISDITIGDFWGIDRETLKEKYEGRISAVLINNKKGMEFFDEAKHSFHFEERTIMEAVNGNDQLRYPTRRHKKRDVFLDNYNKGIVTAYEWAGVQKLILKSKIKRKKWYRGIRKLFIR